jgi:hypothetical protein
MGKVKYYFDTENLAYRKIKPKKGRNIGYIALFLLASALFGFLSILKRRKTKFIRDSWKT